MCDYARVRNFRIIITIIIFLDTRYLWIFSSQLHRLIGWLVFNIPLNTLNVISGTIFTGNMTKRQCQYRGIWKQIIRNRNCEY